MVDEIIQDTNTPLERENNEAASEEEIQARVDAALGRTSEPAQQPPAQKSQPPNLAPKSQPARPGNGNKPVGEQSNIDMLMDVALQLTVELGRAHMTVRQVLDLQNGSVIELDRIAGEAVDIFINEHILARGEVVVVDDKFGVRITELVSMQGTSGDK